MNEINLRKFKKEAKEKEGDNNENNKNVIVTSFDCIFPRIQSTLFLINSDRNL